MLTKYKFAILGLLLGLGFTALTAYGLSVQLPSSIKTGDLLYGKNNTQLTTLSTSSLGSVLSIVNNLPAWVATSTLGIIGGGGTWGSITGTITNQSDLTTRILNLKPYLTVGATNSDYAATGTNDQIGMNNAIGAGNLQVLVKAGTYTLGTATNTSVTLANGSTLQGEGFGTLIQKPVTGNSFNAGLVNIVANDTKVSDLRLDGSNMSTTAFNFEQLIHLGSSYDTKIRDVTFTNANQFGIFIDNAKTGTTSNVSIIGNNMNCNGGQDCIGGGEEDSSGNSTTSDINILGNFITQTINKPGVENSDFDANCLDLTPVHFLNFAENDCFGIAVFGSEQSPATWSKISGNIIQEPKYAGTANAASKTDGDIYISQYQATATQTPSNLMVNGNLIPDGGIKIKGGSGNPIQHLVIYGNSILTGSSTSQSLGGFGQQGIYSTYTKYGNVFGNDITANPSATSTTGIKFDANTQYTPIALNTIKDFPTGIDCGNGTGNKVIFNNFVNDTINTVNCPNIINMNDIGEVSIGTTTAINTGEYKLLVQGTGGSGLRVVSGGSDGIVLGADVNAGTMTAATRKTANFEMPAWDMGANNVLIFRGDIPANGASNDLYIGGAAGASKIAMTALHFMTGAATTTAGGTERLTITSAGNITVATLTPSSLVGTDASRNLNSIALPLSVANGGTGTTTALAVWNLNGTSAYYNAGNIGIATTTPNYPLTVYGNIFISSSTSQFLGPVGTVGAPTYAALYNGDNDDGMYFPATDTVAFVTAGTERARIDSSGNFGIGTSTPVYKTDIYGTAGNANILNISSSSNSSVLKVLAGGKATDLYLSMASSTNSSFYWGITWNGTVDSSSTAPTLSSCGTGSPTVTGSNVAGYFTAGATATSCTGTWSVPYLSNPECSFTDETGTVEALMNYTHSATGFTLSATGLGGTIIDYSCTEVR